MNLPLWAIVILAIALPPVFLYALAAFTARRALHGLIAAVAARDTARMQALCAWNKYESLTEMIDTYGHEVFIAFLQKNRNARPYMHAPGTMAFILENEPDDSDFVFVSFVPTRRGWKLGGLWGTITDTARSPGSKEDGE